MNDWDPFDGFYSLASAAMKTPYQLDLEVKDRRPGSIPREGDWVKVKSMEWYEKWKDENGNVIDIGSLFFSSDMKKYCGRIYKVKDAFLESYRLEGAGTFGWVTAMFEEVYPKQHQIDTDSHIASTITDVSAATPLSCTYPSSPQGIGISYDLGTLSRQGAGIEAWPEPCPQTNLGQSCFGSGISYNSSDIDKIRSKWSVNKEPELQMIKKHRFIKLEKL